VEISRLKVEVTFAESGDGILRRWRTALECTEISETLVDFCVAGRYYRRTLTRTYEHEE
jgi:hypothetical protein